MSKMLGDRLVLGILMCVFGAGLLVLNVQTALTGEEHSSCEVLMPVDKTVLPPVVPPNLSASQTLSSNSEGKAKSLAPKFLASQSVQDATLKKTRERTAHSEKKSALNGISAPKITALNLTQNETSFVLSFSSKQPVAQITSFSLSQPSRFVVDILQPLDVAGENVVRAEKGFVDHVVVGAHADKLRFVFHLTTDIQEKLVPQLVQDGESIQIIVPIPSL